MTSVKKSKWIIGVATLITFSICFYKLVYILYINTSCKDSVTDCMIAIATVITMLITGIGCYIAYIQLRRINATDSSRFLLELRESFSEKRRWKIHRAIKNKTQKDMDYLEKHKVEVNDYLGLFEICEEMIERKTIHTETFRNFYLYRLEYLLSNSWVLKKLLDDDISYWPKLYKLMKRFPELKEEYYETPEQILFWERIEDE